MAQTKKPGYHLYPTMAGQIERSARKSVDKKTAKKLTSRLVCKDMFQRMPELVSSLDWFVLSEEWHWKRQGAEVIFPASASVLDNLVRARFDLGVEGLPGIDLPFESFVLAVPKGYEPVPGVRLNAILATWHEYETCADDIYFPYARYVELGSDPHVNREPFKPGERVLSLCMSTHQHQVEYLRVNVLESALPRVLRARTPEELSAEVGDYGTDKLLFLKDLDSHDLAQQFYALRIIAALGVYHQATEGQYLREGFPDNRAPRILEGEPLKTIGKHTLSLAPRASSSPSEHLRAWHFRQLRDERYYQGEHKHKPKGSRWVFVTEASIGHKVSPHTQE